eukprot:COSAG01_NODE_2699_length_7235_cov_5.600196_5_plen_26_part_01
MYYVGEGLGVVIVSNSFLSCASCSTM